MLLLGLADKREPIFDLTVTEFVLGFIVIVAAIWLVFWIIGKFKSL